jgi:hypothetical protein
MAYAIEIILNRQIADCLGIPVFITDTVGNLLFYNESAEEIWANAMRTREKCR